MRFPEISRFVPRRARARWIVAALLLALALPLGVVAFAQPTRPRAGETPVALKIEASPITHFHNRDATRVRFGELEFRGGLVLRSDYREFGGISGLLMEANGEAFLAISDRGRWLRARIVYDGTRPAIIAGAEMAPILGDDGQPLAVKGWYDTEALAGDEEGALYVGIERVDQIVKFAASRNPLRAHGTPIALPPTFRDFPNNRSIECLVVMPKNGPFGGALITVLERALDAAGDLRAFILGGPAAGEFAIKRDDDFDVSDCTTMPNGDLLILERRFSPLRGAAIRIRRIAMETVKPGVTVGGTQLIFADLGYQIDNLEAISTHRAPSGELVLTLMSDDNFSPLQRTLLLQFTYPGQ